MGFLISLIFKANYLHWVFPIFFFWLGLVFLGLGSFPSTFSQWVFYGSSLLIMAFLMCITEFADIYSDRFTDRVYRPSNPLVTGELKIETAKRIFILQNIIAVPLLAYLLWLSNYNYPLILALTAGWIGGLVFSLPPLRLKERKIIGPFAFGFCCSIIPLVGWLLVRPPDLFIGALSFLMFTGGSGVEITTKLRETSEAFNYGLIIGDNVLNINTVGFKLKVKIAVVLEVILLLGTVCLFPVFGLLGIFNMTLTLFLLAFSLPPVIIGLALRIKDPIKDVKNAQKAFFIICSSLPFISLATFISSIILM